MKQPWTRELKTIQNLLSYKIELRKQLGKELVSETKQESGNVQYILNEHISIQEKGGNIDGSLEDMFRDIDPFGLMRSIPLLWERKSLGL